VRKGESTLSQQKRRKGDVQSPRTFCFQPSRPVDSPCPTDDHPAAGEWCRGRSTKTPTSLLRWGSRLADLASCLLWGPYVSSIGPLERTPYESVVLLEMLPNFISDKDIKQSKFWGAALDCAV